LRDALGDSEDAVDDIRFAVAVDLHRAPFALQQRSTGELDAAQPGLRGVEHGVVELDRNARVLPRDQLVELDCLAHHRIVEEGDVHGLVDSLQHRDRLRRYRVDLRLGEIETQRETRGQIGERDQHADRADGRQHDLPAAPAQQAAKLAAQRKCAPSGEDQAQSGEPERPARRLEKDQVHRERSSQQCDAREQDQSRAKSALHLSAASPGSWC